MRFVVEGAPRTKKNSQRIMRGKNGAPFLAQSAQHDAWAQAAILQLRSQCQRFRDILPHPGLTVNLAAQIYRDRDVGDLGNYLAAVCDALERAGVVENDRLICGFDGSRLRVDKARPRVEIELTEL